MYSMNSTVVVDHDGLFIYVAARYAGSFRDVSIMLTSRKLREPAAQYDIEGVLFKWTLRILRFGKVSGPFFS